MIILQTPNAVKAHRVKSEDRIAQGSSPFSGATGKKILEVFPGYSWSGTGQVEEVVGQPIGFPT